MRTADVALQLGPDACERVFHFLYEWSRRTGIPVDTADAPAFRRVALQREARRRPRNPPAPHPLPLSDGKGIVFVSHTGDVKPSVSLPLTTANVREQRLADVYRHSRLFRVLRNATRLEGKCEVCAYRAVCGGSRARAYAMTANFLAEDPACAYRPGPPSGQGWMATFMTPSRRSANKSYASPIRSSA
jgi:radical SAM protein with 4Fe4S-binding SPASM domain